MKYAFQILAATGFPFLLAGALVAQVDHLAALLENVTPAPYFGERHACLSHNLGPTGARGWVKGEQGHTLDSREILVTSVLPGSPADGVLKVQDIIVGVAAPADGAPHTWDDSSPELKLFTEDARMTLARAITWAESHAGGGKLRLLRHRDGNTQAVTLHLPVLGDYTKGSPFNCEKSRKVVDQAARLLVRHMPPDGFEPSVNDPLNAALLLGTGDPAYLDAVRRSACRMSLHHTPDKGGHETWRWGSTNTFLCEYYLATGDARVLPTIRAYSQGLAAGQCAPGTWGHSNVPDFVPPGYGSLNNSGLVCFLSLVLAHQIGIDKIDPAIERSIRFFGRYAGRGSIPYGDHPPTNPNSANNGKNALAAITFDLLGAKKASRWFALLNASSNLENIENGHTGNAFNQYWSPLGAYLAGSENCSRYWERIYAYRDLSRGPEGGFITQPWSDPREGQLSVINYVYRGPLWTTGAVALGYLVGNDELALLGRRDSPFAHDAPEALDAALKLFRDKDFAAAIAACNGLGSNQSARVRNLALCLAEISQRNIDSLRLTLAAMENNLKRQDLYTLKWQLVAIESIINPADPRLATFRKALAADEAARVMEDAGTFYGATQGFRWVGPPGHEAIMPTPWTGGAAFQSLTALSKDAGSPYHQRAQQVLEARPKRNFEAARPLLRTEDPTWSAYRTDQDLGQDWFTKIRDAAGWERLEPNTLPADNPDPHYLKATFHLETPASIQDLVLDHSSLKALELYLNGTRIFDAQARNLKGPVWDTKPSTLLKPSTRGQLKAGKNEIVARIIPAKKNFKLGLRAIENQETP